MYPQLADDDNDNDNDDDDGNEGQCQWEGVADVPATSGATWLTL